MRLSVRKNDPGYDPIKARRAIVTVDGQRIEKRCHTADEDQGVAWCYQVDANGRHIVIGFDSNKRLAEEEIRGKVEIRFED